MRFEFDSALLRQRYSKTVQIVRHSPEHDAELVILGLAGHLDLAALPSVASAVDQAIDGGASRVVLDLGQVDSIDSAGMGLLTTIRAQCATASVELALASRHSELRDHVARADKTLMVHSSLDDACAALGVST